MIDFCLLGSVALARDDGEEIRTLLARPKQIALLAYLAGRHPRGWQRRNSLLALFWPESDDRRARFSLRTALHGLRAELGPDIVLARGDDEVAINFDLVRCDAVAFEEALAGQRLREALTIYRGPFLEGLIVPGLADFHIWLDERRESLRRQAVGAAVALADAADARGDLDDVLQWNRRAMELSPHEETLLRRALRTLELRGERAEALRVFEQWEARLGTELESEPSPETLSEVARLRAPLGSGTRAPRRTALPAPSTPPIDTMPPPAPTPKAVAEDFHHRSARRRSRVALGAVVGVALLVGALFVHRRTAGATAKGTGTAVLPFAFTGDAKFATLADAVQALLSAGLSGAGPLRTIDPHLVAAFASKQPANASPRAIGARAGAGLGASHFITGSIVEQQGVLRIQAHLYAVGQEDTPLGTATTSGSADSLFVIADRLSTDLLAARLGTVSVEGIGTSSVAALRAYVEGERHLFAAQYARATDAYSRAVAADSEFARAYFRLSYAASLGSHDGLSRTAAARALELKPKLPPADQLMLDAWQHTLKSRIPESIDLYERALGQDSRNSEAWLRLAEIRFHWGPSLGIPPASAAEAFWRVIAAVPDNAPALIHLARIEARESPGGGGFDTLAAAANKLNLTAAEALELRTLAAVLSGRGHESVLAEARARGALTERQLLAAVLPFADTIMAAAFARDLTRSGVSSALRVIGYVELAQIAAAHGRVRAAFEAADSLATIAPDRAAELRAWILTLPFVKATPAELLRARDAVRHVMDAAPFGIAPSVEEIAKRGVNAPRGQYVQAVLSLLAGDTATAVALSRDLVERKRPDRQDSAFAANYAHAIRAELRMRETPVKAIEAFPAPHIEPSKTYPDLMSFFVARERYLRAEALAAAGHVREAITWLETFPDPAGYDVWFLGPALLRRAQLHTSLGERQAARRTYERFIALWQGADGELAGAVKDARAALAR